MNSARQNAETPWRQSGGGNPARSLNSAGAISAIRLLALGISAFSASRAHLFLKQHSLATRSEPDPAAPWRRGQRQTRFDATCARDLRQETQSLREFVCGALSGTGDHVPIRTSLAVSMPFVLRSIQGRLAASNRWRKPRLFPAARGPAPPAKTEPVAVSQGIFPQHRGAPAEIFFRQLCTRRGQLLALITIEEHAASRSLIGDCRQANFVRPAIVTRFNPKPRNDHLNVTGTVPPQTAYWVPGAGCRS